MLNFRNLTDAVLEASVVGSYTKVGIRARRALGPWSDIDAISLKEKAVVITGATSGIGLAAATQLARMGARVRIVGRDGAKTRASVDAIKDSTGNEDVHGSVADLGDLEAVRALAQEITSEDSRLDALVHNAGALLADRTLSPQGHEVTFSSMVLGPTLLTESLLGLLEASRGRVLLMSSGGMYTQRLDVSDPESQSGYRGAKAYAKAKRAQVVLAEEWAARWHDRGITVHALHPGWVATPGVEKGLPTFEKVMRPLLRSPEEGADTLVWLVAAEEPTRTNGKFWLDRRTRATHRVPNTRESQTERTELLALVAAAIEPYLSS